MSTDGSTGVPADPVAAVDAWRGRAGASADPVGVAIAEALARRAQAQQGEARRLLMQRLEQRLSEMEARATGRPAFDDTAKPRGALAELSALIDHLGRSGGSPMQASSSARSATTQPAAAPMPAAPRPLKAIVEHRGTWSRLRVEHRLREALAQVPAGAGPLNTSHLVNRALQAMRDLSPEYLDAFMSHVDTLLRLEQASGGGDLTPRPAAGAHAKPRAGTRGLRKG